MADQIMDLARWRSDVIMQHMDALKRCLTARTRDGRPADLVRVSCWFAIFQSTDEKLPVTLGSPRSRERLGHYLHGALLLANDRWRPADIKRAIDEILTACVSVEPASGGGE